MLPSIPQEGHQRQNTPKEQATKLPRTTRRDLLVTRDPNRRPTKLSSTSTHLNSKRRKLCQPKSKRRSNNCSSIKSIRGTMTIFLTGSSLWMPMTKQVRRAWSSSACQRLTLMLWAQSTRFTRSSNRCTSTLPKTAWSKTSSVISCKTPTAASTSWRYMTSCAMGSPVFHMNGNFLNSMLMSINRSKRSSLLTKYAKQRSSARTRWVAGCLRKAVEKLSSGPQATFMVKSSKRTWRSIKWRWNSARIAYLCLLTTSLMCLPSTHCVHSRRGQTRNGPISRDGCNELNLRLASKMQTKVSLPETAWIRTLSLKRLLWPMLVPRSMTLEQRSNDELPWPLRTALN